jgi:hypothetical protein
MDRIQFEFARQRFDAIAAAGSASGVSGFASPGQWRRHWRRNHNSGPVRTGKPADGTARGGDRFFQPGAVSMLCPACGSYHTYHNAPPRPVPSPDSAVSSPAARGPRPDQKNAAHEPRTAFFGGRRWCYGKPVKSAQDRPGIRNTWITRRGGPSRTSTASDEAMPWVKTKQPSWSGSASSLNA